MKKKKAVLTHFIKDDQVDLNQYLTYLFKQFNMGNRRNQFKEYKSKKVK